MSVPDRAANTARRELILATVFLAVLLLFGTLGYSTIEGWSFIDSLYMTFITLTTIGFSEVHEMTDGSRLFTILIGLSGIGTVAFIAGRSAQLLLNSDLYRQRQLTKMIDRTRDHFIICGFGRIGSRVAEDLQQNDVPFVVIEHTPTKIERLYQGDHLYVRGDAENEETLLRAGVDRARGLILTLPEDSSNVFVTLVARELNPNLFILARTDKNHNRRKLLRAGADKVVSPYEIGADRMAQVILRPNVVRLMEHVGRSGDINLVLEEVQVTQSAPFAGKSLAEVDFRRKFELIVVALISGKNGDMDFNPGASCVMEPGDTMIVLGSGDMVKRLRDAGHSLA